MSPISLGQPEIDLVPDGGTPPGPRRRYLVLAGTVAAILLAGGSAAYLLVAGTQAAHQPLADPFVPAAPADASPLTSLAAGVTGGPSAADPVAGSVPAAPLPTASMTAAPQWGGRYRVPGPLCASLDLTVLRKVAGDGGSTRSMQTDRGAFADLMCNGNLGPAGRVWLTAEVRIFPTVGAAAASYANDQVGTQRVTGVGTRAGDLSPPGAGYVLLVTDANLELRLQVGAVGPEPTPAALRQPAIEMANRALARLRS